MINFQRVSKEYFSNLALDDITFNVEKGDFVFLVGPTGSGKTTIFRLIIRDLLPSSGEISIGNIDVLKLPNNKIRQLRRNVGVIFQDLKLLHDRTVGENVMLPLQLSGISEADSRERAIEVLNSVGLADEFDKFPQQLSGGERQRVAIARALVFDPEVILADEPTGNLDLHTSLKILELLEEINKTGTTIFMATHNDRIIDSTKKRVIVLDRGKIKEDRKSKEPPKPKVEDKKEDKKELKEEKSSSKDADEPKEKKTEKDEKEVDKKVTLDSLQDEE